MLLIQFYQLPIFSSVFVNSANHKQHSHTTFALWQQTQKYITVEATQPKRLSNL